MIKKLLVVCILVTSIVGLKDRVQAAYHGFAVIDADTGRLLFGTNADAKLPIASLTKMWTAYVVIKNSDLQEQVIISEQAALSEGSSIYLKAGESVSVETLLYGLLLRSGNDAAYALAEHVGGSIEGFVKLMNDEALFNGLQHTTFTNPSGLHNDHHLSTAYDTARMLQIAMKNDTFRTIASAKSYKSDTINGTVWSNKHKLMHANEEVKAGKTGYTKIAGRTLATYFEKDGKRCVVVTLNDGNDWENHLAAANRVWNEYKTSNIMRKGNYRVKNDVIVTLKDPIQMLLTDRERKEIRHVLHIPRTKAIDEEGIWSVFLGTERIYSTNVTIR